MEHFEEKGKKYSLITIRMQEAKTIASVYSLRPTINATVSKPIE
jgi:DNA primase